MTTVGNKIICGIFTACFMLSLPGCTGHPPEGEAQIMPFDREESKRQNEGILENIYYENSQYAFWYGSTVGGMMEDDFDYYNIFWILSIEQLTNNGITGELKEIMERAITSKAIVKSEKYRYDGIFDVYIRAGIEKYLNLQVNTEEYLS